MKRTRDFVDFVVDVYTRFSRDAGSFLAATISYYALFSIFPLLLLTINVAGIFTGESAVTQAILDYTQEALPKFSGIVRTNIEAIVKNRQSTSIVSILALVWIGTAVFDAVEYAMNRVWDVKAGRHFILSKLRSIAGIIVVILVLILTTLFSTAFEAFQAYWGSTFSAAPPLSTLRATTFIAVISITFFALTIIYSVIPNLKLRFKDVWIGAAFTTIVLEIAKRLFVIYTSRVARFNAIYGSVGVIVGLLFWLYIMGMILLIGAEINAALKQRARAAEPE